ncbi:MAG: type II secretion system F family protein [Halococcoides sp.]
MLAVGYAPLVVAIAFAGVVLARSRIPSVDRRLTRAALVLGLAVPDRPDRRRLLGAAAIPTTYRIYAAETWLLSAIAAMIAGVVGVYLVGWLLAGTPVVVVVLSIIPSLVTAAVSDQPITLSVTTLNLLAIEMAGGFGAAGLAAVGTYLWRWQRLQNLAIERRRAIDAALPRTVAFMYALTRGGTSVTEAMETIGRNRSIHGAAAEEIGVAVREMELFGSDVVTATQRMASRSPSERFRTFGENFASVLRSGRSLSAFFREQYQQFREGAADRQAERLDRLATVAEAYVTILVAGVLFLVTILLVMGLTVSETLGVVRAIVYLVIPLGNAIVIVYLDQSLQGIEVAGSIRDRPAVTDGSTERPGPDDRAAPETRRRLAIADRVRRLRSVLSNPVGTAVTRPSASVVLTIPIAALVVGYVILGLDLSVRPVYVLDDAFVWATLIVIVPYGVLRALYRRRVRRIEAAVPDLLDRLASLNEAGLSMVESIERVRDSDLGALGSEVDALWRDIQLGATVAEAIDRFQARIGTPTIDRVMALVTHAHHASGAVGPVLRIAADDVRSSLRLRRQRRQEMLTYLIVIYVSFAVFVLVALVVRLVLIPSLPESGTVTAGADLASGSLLGRIGTVNRAAYALTLTHAVLIQAACSGVVAGQLGEGRVADGLKHAAIMIAAAYLIVALVTGPVATIALGSTSTTAIEVDAAMLSNGGYLVVHADGPDGPVVGRTDYLAPGTHGDLTIAVDRPASDLTIVAHRDVDGDRQFSGADSPYPDGPGRQSIAI